MQWEAEFDRRWQAFEAAVGGRVTQALAHRQYSAIEAIIASEVARWSDPEDDMGSWLCRLHRAYPVLGEQFTMTLRQNLSTGTRAPSREQPASPISRFCATVAGRGLTLYPHLRRMCLLTLASVCLLYLGVLFTQEYIYTHLWHRYRDRLQATQSCLRQIVVQADV